MFLYLVFDLFEGLICRSFFVIFRSCPCWQSAKMWEGQVWSHCETWWVHDDWERIFILSGQLILHRRADDSSTLRFKTVCSAVQWRGCYNVHKRVAVNLLHFMFENSYNLAESCVNSGKCWTYHVMFVYSTRGVSSLGKIKCLWVVVGKDFGSGRMCLSGSQSISSSKLKRYLNLRIMELLCGE